MKSIKIRSKISLMMFSILGALLLTQFLSCYRDVINLDLEDFGPQIVIESIMTDQPGPYLVRICKTGALNQLNNFPIVSGADVVILDNSGNSETLTESEDGRYETRNLRGIPGRTYTLQVKAEGKEFSAVSRMPEPLSMDYISFQNLGWGYIMVCAFTDREGEDDFCRLQVFKNGELAERYLYQGKYSDGEQIIIDDFETDFSAGDRVRVELHTITEETFIYLSQLNPQEGGGNYDPNYPEYMVISLSNPKSNINNDALGYFSAQSVRSYNRIVR